MSNDSAVQVVSVGKAYPENKYGTFKVTKVHNSRGRCAKRDPKTKVTVAFTDTGFERTVSASTLAKGTLLDYSLPSVAGLGFMGISPEEVDKLAIPKDIYKAAYSIWFSMLDRTSESSKFSSRYWSRNVHVCNHWHSFKNFLAWYVDNLPLGGDYVLDSDFLSPQNEAKKYSPETCCFIPQELNKFMGGCYRSEDGHPYGVTKNRNKFKARVTHCGNTSGKTFETPWEAFEWYKELKEFVLQELSDKLYQCGKIPKDVYEACQIWQVVPYPR